MRYTNRHILGFLEDWAPQSTKLEYDNVGLLTGSEDQYVSRLLVCLDVTPEIVDEAVATGADLIIAHHPLIFRKLSRITPSDPTGSLIYRLIKKDISVIAAHTNLDAALGGVSFMLAEWLGLLDVHFLKPGGPPALPDGNRADVGSKRDHRQTGFGAIGRLPEALAVTDFLERVAGQLGSQGIRYTGSPDRVSKVAVCGGAGSFLADEARRQGADAFVTADLKYHDFFTGFDKLLLVDAGHYETEVPVAGALCNRIGARFPELDVHHTEVNTNPVRYFFQKQSQRTK